MTRKTAEEVLRQELNITAVKHGEDPVLNEDWDDWKDEQGPEFMKAMWDSYTKFAAQEVEAYKQRVFKAVAIMERSSLSEIVDARDEGYAEAVSDAMRLIDSVK